MLSTTTEPIATNWTPTTSADLPGEAIDATPITASDVNGRLARLDVSEIDPTIVPVLAAAAAELALVSGIPWRFSADDPPVALLRLIAKAAIVMPTASGPHTARLLTQLG